MGFGYLDFLLLTVFFMFQKEDYFAKTGVRVLTVCFGAADTALITTVKVGSLDKNIPPEFISGAVNKILYVQK